MESIKGVDYRYAKRVFKSFDNKNIRDYHDLSSSSDTSLLADVFEKFRNKCTEIHKLDPTNDLSASGLEWQACLKKTEIRLELLTDIDMFLMAEKGIRGEIWYIFNNT